MAEIKEFSNEMKISFGAIVSFTVALATATWLIASVYFEFKLHSKEIEWVKDRIQYVNERHDRINERMDERLLHLESLVEKPEGDESNKDTN